MDQSVQNILATVLHQGLHTYKQAKSKHIVALNDVIETGKKGAVAGFFSKASMADGRGVIFTSEEGLFEKAARLSHWTPNIFNYLTYTDKNRVHIKGHREDNLSQINTFVVDIDFVDSQDADLHFQEVIRELAIGDVYLPTMVIKSNKGFHVYYVLDDPVYISRNKNNQMPALQAAQAIAKNIKTEIQTKLPQVDVGCNNFGIFRMPSEDNLVFFEQNFRVSFAALMQWSKGYSDRVQRDRLSNLHVVKKHLSSKTQMEQDWFKALIQVTGVKPGMGLGRHNTILTLALACYSSGYEENACFDLMDEFNSRLEYPIKNQDVKNSVRDAYSGRFSGASREYIHELVDTWAPEVSVKRSQQTNNWYKYKKSRQDRKYSHTFEWEQDLLRLINDKAQENGFLNASMRDIKEILGISLASLDRVVKSLRSKKLLIYRQGKGRKSAQFATVGSILSAIRRVNASARIELLDLLRTVWGTNIVYANVVSNAERPRIRGTG